MYRNLIKKVRLNFRLPQLYGQSMIEVAIALAIATIIITALITSVLSSLDSAQYSKNLNLASQYSQEGIEAMRAKVGVGQGTYCMPDGSVPPALLLEDTCNNAVNVAGFFQRKVTVEPLSGNCGNILTEVVVRTAWKDGKCQGNLYCHESRLASCMNNL